MLVNPLGRAEFVRKGKRRHQSLEPNWPVRKQVGSNHVIRRTIQSDDNRQATNRIGLTQKPSSFSVNFVTVRRQKRSKNQRNANEPNQAGRSSKIGITLSRQTATKNSNNNIASSIDQHSRNQQVSKSYFDERNLTDLSHQNAKQQRHCFSACHCSSCRISLFSLATFLLCVALAALIVSILTRPKDTTITRSMVSILWTFDNDTEDKYNTYNGIAVNNPSYVTGYAGLNSQALSLNGSSSQYVKVDDPLFEFTYRSFTVEIWFYPTLLTADDFGLFGQCEAMEKDRCLTLMIRNYHVYFGFYDDDLSGTTTLLTNRWYHVAFVYDYSTSTQLLYLDGYLESSQISNKYQGANRTLTIGAVKTGPSDFFFGYIDQISLITSIKSANEIFYDATFVFYYSFDASPYMDTGLWNLTGLDTGITPAIGTGRVNDAASFTAANKYFLIGGLGVLGSSSQSYSMTLWIKPASVSGGSIVYVSKCNTNCGSNWCMPFIGLTSSGQIVIQSWSSTSGGTLVSLTGPTLFTNIWTHVVYTYNPANGMRLYLNGILFRQSSAFSSMGSGSSNYVYLGSFPLTTCTQTSGIISATQYYGIVDEYYLYAQELTAIEVTTLANP